LGTIFFFHFSPDKKGGKTAILTKKDLLGTFLFYFLIFFSFFSHPKKGAGKSAAK
jgi:hypothetical protein